MGYFFRRSAKIGPFRLNFSKSGIGASVGVKGARLTMTPRGTTYITVGSHGFYYRESLSNNSGNPPHIAVPPAIVPTASRPWDEIVTAAVSDLVDSSSESLINGLNERARMFNPAWVLYIVAAGMAILGLAPLLNTQDLPIVTGPFGIERRSNSLDEYTMLVARYGDPESILSNEPLGIVAVRTANYRSEQIKVIFAPSGCLEVYEAVMRIRAEQSRHPALAKRELKRVARCVPSPNTAWTIVGYVDSAENRATTVDVAKAQLDKITVKRTSPPLVEIENGIGNKQRTSSRGLAKEQAQPKPEMRFNRQAWVAEEQMRQNAEIAKRWELYSRSALLFGGLGLFVMGLVVQKKNTEKRTSRLFYELDETERQKYGVVQQTLTHLAKSQRIWRVEGSTSTTDWKRNAGASSLLRRTSISVGCSNPPRVETNVTIPCINIGRVRLFFLPDVILYWENGSYGAVPYNDFLIEQGFTRFIEEEHVPADTTIVDQTWRYVNKSGGPDRRFNNNIQLPVVQYGVLVLASSRGLNIHLHTSNAEVSVAVANCWRELHSRIRQPQERQSTAQGVSDIPSGPEAQALRMLGLSASASPGEVSAAYRHLAQMYHPDKVAGLAPEFQALADMRMREINAAHETLKSRALVQHENDKTLPNVKTTFATESERARKLALEHGQFWEHLLTMELLTSKLAIIQAEYDKLDATAALSPKRSFTGVDYMNWLSIKLHDFTYPVAQIGKCMERELTAAWGEPGKSGDAIQILKVVDEIVNYCRVLVNWELEISLAEPPITLQRLGAALRGAAAGIIAEVRRVPFELGRAVVTARTSEAKQLITLSITTPPQIANFLAELDIVKTHPEWVMS